MDIVAELLEKAETQGFLTVDEVLEALASLNGRSPGDVLCRAQTGRVGDRGADEEEDEEEDIEFVEGLDEEEDLDWDEDVYNLDGIGVDDTVALYLREMARVPLLTNEEEVTLAKAIERGCEAEHLLQEGRHTAEERACLDQLVDEGLEARDT